MASLAAMLIGTGLSVPPAVAAPAAPPSRAEPVGADLTIPPLITEEWDGKTGVKPLDPRLWKLVEDIAALHEEPTVRAAAVVALTGDDQSIRTFLTVTQPKLKAEAAQRRKETAAANLAKIKAMAGTGVPGGYFNVEVERVLKGTDSDRDAFLAYGADIARARDEQVAKNEQARREQLRARLTMLVAAAPTESQVRAAAQAALAGDDAAVAAFWATGYLAAARADAAAREQYLKDLEARNKAAEELSDLAKRAKRASEARTLLLRAHGDGVRALQRTAKDMAGAANAARHAERVLARPGTAASKSAELNAAKSQTASFVENAGRASEQARVAATIAATQADVLIETGLTYGAEWSLIAQGMSEASTAAVGAATTAQHAIDATIATNNAQGAQAQAEAHAKQAAQWRKHAQEHAAAAAKLATAAKKQADAAKTAAARTAAARQQAEAAEAKAWAEAEKTRQHRQVAETKAAEAKAARQVAERERANAATHRAEAERQAAAARAARSNAEFHAGVAAGARQRAEDADTAAGAASSKAWVEEGNARRARDAAAQAEQDERAAKARAQATRAAVAAADSDAARAEAQAQADEAESQAGVASTAARSSRAAANTATGAAANARGAAGRAEQAAERAWAAAEQARAAAVAADAAADRAEASAKATHAARVRADAKAAEATVQEVRAAEAASKAVDLAGRAADEAVQALWAANRTQAEAEAATTEAVAAAAQAEIAVAAATAAAQSSAGIAEPHNTALAMVSPFAGADLDADFVADVVAEAKVIGAEQAAAAQRRADEAIAAAALAEAAANRANAEVKPAFEAAAQAARSAADAARSAAEAKAAAARAAADGAAAREAAASAARADAQARADAVAARQAANEAANDAAIAGRSAAEAQRDADAAGAAASAAEADAAAARGAADGAEADAAAAADSAASAQRYADSAATAASKALEHAVAAQQAAERAEAAERQRDRDAAADAYADAVENPGPVDEDLLDELTPQEREELLKARSEAAESFWDFLRAEAPQLLKDLSGIQGIEDCIRTGDVLTCLYAASDFIPAKRLSGFLWDLGKFGAKILKFFTRTRGAGKKADDLLEKAKQRQRAKSCPIPGAPKVRVASARAAAASPGGNSGNSIGDRREEYIAKLLGGSIAKDDKGNDIPLVVDQIGSTGLDVRGPNGEYVFVGGPGKAASPSRLGDKLKVAKAAADRDGVRAIYYFDKDTPEAAIKLAKKWFGEGNVFSFDVDVEIPDKDCD
ncbi:hypothetical protein [Actinoplanes sp. URMC 104]|uniref:hypothetical protein n=1 Tax=Actinoplanes sp. URMC 104 TaxID=3423409 RepID=UPI003F1996DC